MTYKEALRWLDENAIGNLEVKAIVSNLLLKQNKKPVVVMKKRYYCPLCCGPLDDSKHYKSLSEAYCYHCRQALDWKRIVTDIRRGK